MQSFAKTMQVREERRTLEMPALMIVEEGEPLMAQLVNFSRHGFRLHVAGHYLAGQCFRLEVAGWPRLGGKVVWNDNGRIGCVFETPPCAKTFTAMCASLRETA